MLMSALLLYLITIQKPHYFGKESIVRLTRELFGTGKQVRSDYVVRKAPKSTETSG